MDTAVIREKQDLTRLDWSRTRNSAGCAGSFLKAQSSLGGEKIYYKLSAYDRLRGVTGHESVNEIVADRLLTLFGAEHLHYQLLHADILVDGRSLETWLCASGNYRKKTEGKQSLDIFYESRSEEGESPLAFCRRMGWEETIYEMLAFDYIILNRDRHGANIEVLKDKRTGECRLAPLFDHGLSLLCRCETVEEAEAFDVLQDRPVQSFVGTGSVRENLELIPPERMPAFRPPAEGDRDFLFEGLEDAVPARLLDRMWEMICGRWESYEDIRDQRQN